MDTENGAATDVQAGEAVDKQEPTAPEAQEGATPPETPESPQAPDDSLGDAGKKALAAERDARKQAEQVARQLKADLDAAQAKITDADARADAARQAAELVRARYEVAAERGLPIGIAQRLVGNTREELEADADSLKAQIAPAFIPPSDPTQGRDRGGNAGGSIDSGRSLYQRTHKSKKEN